jgi:stalled ribosome rescue protein Dom34
MSHYHAVVWLDHNEAHIMHISPDDVETSVVKPAVPHRNLQRKRGSVSGSRQPEDQHFYHEVVEAMSGATEVLIVGPGHAKLELIKHIHAHDPKIADKVIGVETVDHPSDAQVVAFARKYFVAKDRMLSQ